LILAAAFEELRDGNHVLYIDFEDDEGGVVGRLLTLQTPAEWIRKRFHLTVASATVGGWKTTVKEYVVARRP
jgi:hypothetical protein